MTKRAIQPHRAAMPCAPADVRRQNFDEVALGYTPELAVIEASRCIECRNRPCIAGCPVDIDIPGFVARVAAGDFESASATERLDDDWWWYAAYVVLAIAGIVAQVRATERVRGSLREQWAGSGGRELRTS